MRNQPRDYNFIKSTARAGSVLISKKVRVCQEDALAPQGRQRIAVMPKRQCVRAYSFRAPDSQSMRRSVRDRPSSEIGAPTSTPHAVWYCLQPAPAHTLRSGHVSSLVIRMPATTATMSASSLIVTIRSCPRLSGT